MNPTLESQQPPAVEMICGNCVHFVPQMNYKTMRALPSKAGDCCWKCPVNFPMSVLRAGPTITSRVQVFKNTCAKTCKCFTAKKE